MTRRFWGGALRAAAALSLLLAVLSAPGCGKGRVKEDPILRLSAEEALAIGKQLLEEKKFRKAREHFTHAFEVEPNSPGGREALLLSADAYFMSGGLDNYTKAEAKYRDFQNRFPTSDRSAYVQYQIANSLAQRMLKPDRDQSATRKALEAFEDVIRLYPTSAYADEARLQIQGVRKNLAEHELLVAEFNMKVGLVKAAAARLETLMSEYPEYEGMEDVLFELVTAYRRMDEGEKAKEALATLESRYPQSAYLEKLRQQKVKKTKRKGSS